MPIEMPMGMPIGRGDAHRDAYGDANRREGGGTRIPIGMSIGNGKDAYRDASTKGG